jgi:hypothetical protein
MSREELARLFDQLTAEPAATPPPTQSSHINLLSKRRTASGLMIVCVKVILPSYEKEDNIWMDSEAQKM